MDSSSSVEFIDALKARKAMASLRYLRMSQIKVLMHIAEVCLAVFILLTLCFGGGFSLTVESAVDYFLRLFDLFRSPPTVFLLINMIIVAIALMSGYSNDTKREASPVTDVTDRIYNEYVGYVSRRANVLVSEVHPRGGPEKIPPNNLQIVPYVVNQPKLSQPVKCAESNVSKIHVIPNLVKADAKVRSQRGYKRTKSTLEGKREEEIINNQVLRRSMTENGRCMTRRSVDDLSNEEFNQKVESFIARRRCFLQRELIADMTVGVVPMESHNNISTKLAVIVRN